MGSRTPRSENPLGPPRFLPAPENATAEGLVALGGQLTVDWLLDAYTHAVFPWPMDERLLAWWSPDPRAVIEFDQFHVPSRLARRLRQPSLQITHDQAFDQVLAGCATSQHRRHNTWLTPAMRSAYLKLHRAGHAHSVEVWHENQLVGGVYGVSLGAMFSAESMFYRQPEASKIALVTLVRHLRARGYTLLDIQQLTPHTARFGASEIPRREFIRRLADALQSQVTFGTALEV